MTQFTYKINLKHDFPYFIDVSWKKQPNSYNHTKLIKRNFFFSFY